MAGIRDTMAALVDRVEALLRDEGNVIWSEQAIADELDRHRLRVNYAPCLGEPSYPAGVETFLTFVAPYGSWEEDVVLTDSQYTVVSTSNADYQGGRFTIGSEPANRPVLVVGWTYDVYGCAEALISEYLIDLAGQFDFQADGGSYSRSQKYDMYERLGQSYARKALGFSKNSGNGVVFTEMIRSDVNVQYL